MIQRIYVVSAVGWVYQFGDDREGLMAIQSLADLLRWIAGKEKKEKSVFASEREAYEFTLATYKESGGVTPELRRAFEFYQKNYNDDCGPNSRF